MRIVGASPTVVWFRLDLRLADNPALHAAAARGGAVIPVFIWAPEEEGAWPPGAASRWWLHQSLAQLDASLRAQGVPLTIRRGPTRATLRDIVRETGADTVVFNGRHEPALAARDAEITTALRAEGIAVDIHNSALLFAPLEILTAAGTPFQVFTPFSRACQLRRDEFPILPAPRGLLPAANPVPSLPLAALALEPEHDWTRGLRDMWTPGESGAHRMLDTFVASRMRAYPDARDRPAVPGTARLSPHLHFGECSPRQAWEAARTIRGAGSDAFRRQLLWREFAHHLLAHYPHTTDAPLREEFTAFPWRTSASDLRAWQRGDTGYDIVDAGMRELWHTGWMHNRVRMIVASFLVKDLLIDWREGARWFWDTLVDADLANNTLGWQWTAGCGADAAPYFRVFNPLLQQTKFDPDGAYVKRWRPADARGVRAPIVDHAAARARALDALAEMKVRAV